MILAGPDVAVFLLSGIDILVEPLGIAMPADTLLINWTQNFLNLLAASGELEKRKNFWFKDASWLSELP